MGLDMSFYRINKKVKTEDECFSYTRVTSEDFIKAYNKRNMWGMIIAAYNKMYIKKNLKFKLLKNIKQDINYLKHVVKKITPDEPEELAYFRNWWDLNYYVDRLYQRDYNRSYNFIGRYILTKEVLQDMIAKAIHSKNQILKDLQDFDISEYETKDIEKLKSILNTTDWENQTVYVMAWW